MVRDPLSASIVVMVKSSGMEAHPEGRHGRRQGDAVRAAQQATTLRDRRRCPRLLDLPRRRCRAFVEVEKARAI